MESDGGVVTIFPLDEIVDGILRAYDGRERERHDGRKKNAKYLFHGMPLN
jgi:hypothetical protein